MTYPGRLSCHVIVNITFIGTNWDIFSFFKITCTTCVCERDRE